MARTLLVSMLNLLNWLSLLMLSLFTSCVVTDTIAFDAEENFPASIAPTPAAQDANRSPGSIIFTDLDDALGNPISLSVFVRDPNIRQTLSWRLFVNFRPDSPAALRNSGVLEPTADNATQRLLELDVDYNDLDNANPGCHKIELLVSAGFSDRFPQREPVLEGDLAQTLWWVYATNSTTPTIDFRNCPP